MNSKKHRGFTVLQTVENDSFLAPRIYEGVARRAGGSPNICVANIRKIPFFRKNGQTPSVTMAPGFARIHRDTSPINGGARGA